MPLASSVGRLLPAPDSSPRRPPNFAFEDEADVPKKPRLLSNVPARISTRVCAAYTIENPETPTNQNLTNIPDCGHGIILPIFHGIEKNNLLRPRD